MQGLRTQENEKFLRFFAMVQAAAEKMDAVFFVDCGQGDVFENDKIECEDLCGWLIPCERVAEFEPLFLANGEEQNEFDDFYRLADYVVDGDSVRVVFS